jgi:hypothetical protein
VAPSLAKAWALHRYDHVLGYVQTIAHKVLRLESYIYPVQTVASVVPEFRAEMAKYLEASAHVVIYRLDEGSEDVPPYAIDVKGTAFWIDCCATQTRQRNGQKRSG